ncbi:hypothetical protein [Pedobacter sp. MC2016-24]|uniref:hypothetical protein n=1 Tax=Pedobacter sp. MC2016-24 TaxID=2780090 RepID=UPI0018804C64|nr:hypothetical protein [Pedobacter sp. MC2016-24]MBE9601814.1 hypothetical protein [Pedobacter sp. MC2016-24]
MKKTLTALVFIMLLLPLISCKKNKRPKSKDDIETPDESPGKKNYLPVKFESSSLHIYLKYKEGTKLLTEINGSDGERILITYTSAQIPLKLEKYKQTTLVKLIDYHKDGQQQITQCTSFDYDAINRTYIPLGDINIGYDVKAQINNLKFFDDLNKFTKALTLLYNSTGNLSVVEVTAQTGNNTLNYTYDQQTGIYKHVPYAALFSIALEHYFFSSSNNNLLNFSNQKNSVEDTTYTYEYNQEGYPIQMIVSQNKTTQRFKISYIEAG